MPNYYNDKFSIYLYRTDSGTVAVFPKSAAEERTKILNKIFGMMRQYKDKD